MRKSITSAFATAIKPQIVKPQLRSIKKVATSPFEVEPKYREMIATYTSNLNDKVIENFIEDSELMSSVFEFMGRLPFEVQDIEKHVREENFRKALFEIDDMIQKAITWRIKLSHKVSN